MKRVLSAAIGFPLVVIVLTFGNTYIVDGAFSIIAMLALYEFYHAFKVSRKSKPHFVDWLYICSNDCCNTYNPRRNC